MALPNPISAADVLHQRISHSAIGSVIYMPVVCPGRIKDFHVCIDAAVGTADETFTLAYAPPTTGTPSFTNVTSGTVVTPTAASAAGLNVRQQIAPSTSAYVQDGGTLRITPSGGGSAGVPLTVAVVIGP